VMTAEQMRVPGITGEGVLGDWVRAAYHGPRAANP